MYYEDSLHDTATFTPNVRPLIARTFSATQETYVSERRWSHDVSVLLVTKGSFKTEINLEKFDVQEGEIAIFNAEDLWQIEMKDPDSGYELFQFDPLTLAFSYPDECQNMVIFPFIHHQIRFPHIVKKDNVCYDELLNIFSEIFRLASEKPKYWYINCKPRLYDWMFAFYETDQFQTGSLEMSETERLKIDRFKKIVTYMEYNYSKNVTLAELSELTHLNEQYLCRFFKELTGMSPIQYLIEVRLDNACRMLRETNKSILDISTECGFGSVSYFIRKFKEAKGITPKKYRSQTNRALQEE